MTNPLILTRPEHDFILSENQPLLKRAFEEGKKHGKICWSLGGVAMNVPNETYCAVHEILKRFVPEVKPPFKFI